MLTSLLQPHPSLLLIIQNPNIERERSSLLLHLREHSPRRLHLQLIRHRRIALVDRRFCVFRSGLHRLSDPKAKLEKKRERKGERAYLPIFTRRNKNIHTINLVLRKRHSLEIPSLLLARVKNNPLLTINDVLGLLTREHACTHAESEINKIKIKKQKNQSAIPSSRS